MVTIKGLICSAILIGIASSPAYANPEQVPGEPKIEIKRVSPYPGKVYTQHFSDAGTIKVEHPKGSIADFHRISRGFSGNLPEASIPAKCMIRPSGLVVFNCKPHRKLTDAEAVSFTVGTSSQFMEGAPKFRMLTGADIGIIRTADIVFQIPKITFPLTDLTSGPLVSREEVVLNSTRNFVQNYPRRALRAEAQGKQTVECQVQSDFSIICRSLDFDPPIHHDLFRSSARNLGRSEKAQPLLKNGQPSKGVRFRMAVVYKLH